MAFVHPDSGRHFLGPRAVGAEISDYARQQRTENGLDNPDHHKPRNTGRANAAASKAELRAALLNPDTREAALDPYAPHATLTAQEQSLAETLSEMGMSFQEEALLATTLDEQAAQAKARAVARVAESRAKAALRAKTPVTLDISIIEASAEATKRTPKINPHNGRRILKGKDIPAIGKFHDEKNDRGDRMLRKRNGINHELGQDAGYETLSDKKSRVAGRAAKRTMQDAMLDTGRAARQLRKALGLSNDQVTAFSPVAVIGPRYMEVVFAADTMKKRHPHRSLQGLPGGGGMPVQAAAAPNR